MVYPGADPGFEVMGGGCALKKNAPSRGRRENFWGISCEKSRFYAKKSYFSNFRGGGEGHQVFLLIPLFIIPMVAKTRLSDTFQYIHVMCYTDGA